MPPEGEREPQLHEPDLLVAQNINIVPDVMLNLSRITQARSPRQAALPIVHILTDLCTLEPLDELFQRDWDEILDGEFEEWACNPRWRRDIEWEDIFAAKAALLRMMERRGMTLKVEGRDPQSVVKEAVSRRFQEGRLAQNHALDPSGGELND